MLFDELVFEIRQLGKASSEQSIKDRLLSLASELEKNGIEDEHFPEEV